MAVWRTRELHITSRHQKRLQQTVTDTSRLRATKVHCRTNARRKSSSESGISGSSQQGPRKQAYKIYKHPKQSETIRNNPKLQPQSPNFTLASSSTCIKSYQVHESKEYSRHSIDHKTAWFRCKAKRSVGSFSHNELLTLSQPLLINTPFLCMSPICPRLIHSAQCRFRWTPCTSLA